jgi:hypothetical protein
VHLPLLRSWLLPPESDGEEDNRRALLDPGEIWDPLLGRRFSNLQPTLQKLEPRLHLLWTSSPPVRVSVRPGERWTTLNRTGEGESRPERERAFQRGIGENACGVMFPCLWTSLSANTFSLGHSSPSDTDSS